MSGHVVAYLNILSQETSSRGAAAAPVATSVPMDGYHLTRAQLSAMPDPEMAHARRGAEFTFNGEAYLELVQSLRAQEPIGESTQTVYAPSFDHAVKDPVDNDIPIYPHHRVLIFEGNYVALDKTPWTEAAALMDEVWFVDVDFALARQRLIKRHMQAGLASDEEAAGRRADNNDLKNGQEIVRLRLRVDETITSVEEDEWGEHSSLN
jgi:pantothenate kinase